MALQILLTDHVLSRGRCILMRQSMGIWRDRVLRRAHAFSRWEKNKPVRVIPKEDVWKPSGEAEQIPLSSMTARQLESMVVKLEDEKDPPQLAGDAKIVSSLMKALSNLKSRFGAQLTERVLANQVERSSLSSGIRPSAEMYHHAIEAWFKSKSPQGGTRAKRILDVMRQEHESAEEGDDRPPPDAINYARVIKALCESGGRRGISQAVNLLKEMEGSSGNKKEVLPDVVCYNVVLAQLAKLRRMGEAENLFRWLSHSSELRLKPDVYSYSAIISGYAKIGTKAAAQKAEILLEEMQSRCSQGEYELMPDRVVYNTVLGVFAKAGMVEKAEALLDNMYVIQAEADQRGFLTDVTPNTRSYAAVMNGYARLGNVSAVEKLLKQMMRLAENRGHDVKPNAIVYNSLINAIARSNARDAGNRAEQVLIQIQDMANNVSYSTAILAWYRSDHPQAPERALRLLDQLQNIYLETKDTKMFPNLRCYQSVIATHAKYGQLQKAEDILERARAFSLQTHPSNHLHLPPNAPTVHTYNIILNAWSRDESPLNFLSARNLLANMRSARVRPDAASYHFVLAACASRSGGDALDAAVQTHAELLEDGQVNPRVSGDFLAVSQGDRAAETVYREWCKDGLITDAVLRVARGMLSEEEYRTLVGCAKDGAVLVAAAELPRKWSRNSRNKNKCKS